MISLYIKHNKTFLKSGPIPKWSPKLNNVIILPKAQKQTSSQKIFLVYLTQIIMVYSIVYFNVKCVFFFLNTKIFKNYLNTTWAPDQGISETVTKFGNVVQHTFIKKKTMFSQYQV